MFLSVRRVIAVAFVSAACLGVFMVRDGSAQSTGVKGGIQWSTLKSDGDSAAAPVLTRRPDLLGGVFFQYGARTVMVQLEGLVSQRGSRSDVGGVRVDSEVLYFEIPVLLRVNVAKMGRAAVFVGGGAALASRWRAHSVVGGVSTDAKYDVSPYDVQWIVAGGVNFHCVMLDGRYTRGTINTHDHAPDGAPETFNDSFGVSIGYGF